MKSSKNILSIKASFGEYQPTPVASHGRVSSSQTNRHVHDDGKDGIVQSKLVSQHQKKLLLVFYIPLSTFVLQQTWLLDRIHVNIIYCKQLIFEYNLAGSSRLNIRSFQLSQLPSD